MGKLIDKTGQRFGRLKVIELSHVKERYGSYWLCKCDCGEEKVIRSNSLRRGHTQSCGCLHKEIRSRLSKQQKGKKSAVYRHGKEKSAEYTVWTGMTQRCNNPKHKYYKNYGGRGVMVCDKWTDFVKFYEDMGDRPEGTTLDRIDNNGNYEPSNCRWATTSEQQNNKRSCHFITYQGVTLTVTEWARKIDVKPGTLRSRIWRGWPTEKALYEWFRGEDA